MDSTDFRQLMDRVRRRDEVAIRELLEAFSPHVIGAVRRSLTPETRREFDSSDFAQIVWGSVLCDLQQIEQLDSPQRLAKFLIKVARHKVVDQYRRQFLTQKRDAGQQVSLDGDLDEQQLAAAKQFEATPSEHAMAAELWDRLLARTPQHFRPILQLRREGLSCDEIAERLGINERTVRRLLKKLMEEQG